MRVDCGEMGWWRLQVAFGTRGGSASIGLWLVEMKVEGEVEVGVDTETGVMDLKEGSLGADEGRQESTPWARMRSRTRLRRSSYKTRVRVQNRHKLAKFTYTAEHDDSDSDSDSLRRDTGPVTP